MDTTVLGFARGQLSRYLAFLRRMAKWLPSKVAILATMLIVGI